MLWSWVDTKCVNLVFYIRNKLSLIFSPGFRSISKPFDCLQPPSIRISTGYYTPRQGLLWGGTSKQLCLYYRAEPVSCWNQSRDTLHTHTSICSELMIHLGLEKPSGEIVVFYLPAERKALLWGSRTGVTAFEGENGPHLLPTSDSKCCEALKIFLMVTGQPLTAATLVWFYLIWNVFM